MRTPQRRQKLWVSGFGAPQLWQKRSSALCSINRRSQSRSPACRLDRDPLLRPFHHRSPEKEAVLAAHERLAGALGVGHHAEDVAALVDDAGDVPLAAVGIRFRRYIAVGVE